MICFLYSSCFGSKDEPMPLIAIGPDWKMSIAEIILINGGVMVSSNWNKGIVKDITIYVLAFQNIFFIITVLLNPGLLQRDPSIHSQAYLKHLATNNKEKALCMECKLIRPKGIQRIEHCEECGVCVLYHDHHCIWSSKCIGGYNLLPFYLFIFSTVSCIVLFYLNLFEIGNTSKNVQKSFTQRLVVNGTRYNHSGSN